MIREEGMEGLAQWFPNFFLSFPPAPSSTIQISPFMCTYTENKLETLKLLHYYYLFELQVPYRSTYYSAVSIYHFLVEGFSVFVLP